MDQEDKIMFMLGEIKADIKNIGENQSSFSKALIDLRTDVTALQLFKSNIAGKMVIVMAIGTFLINAIWEWAKEKIKI